MRGFLVSFVLISAASSFCEANVLLVETIAQHEAVISSLERTVRSLRDETSRLRDTIAILTGALETQTPPDAAETILGVNTAALLSRARFFIASAGRSSSNGTSSSGESRSSGVDALAQPQEITIRCTGASTVTSNLIREPTPDGECLIFDFASADASARFAVFCGSGANSNNGDGDAKDIESKMAADKADADAAAAEADAAL